ncbi:MAG: CDP-diacylglycerol--serine O-phosphatidyltransferase [Polaribacter sp.]|jgi:CDP-diacylglycerol--serine O-phosphatidyltransferase
MLLSGRKILKKNKPSFIESLQSIEISEDAITILDKTSDYKKNLLGLIKSAKKRIYITTLYLQDDDAGQEVLTALYEAKQSNPKLDIKIFVDFLRAQRGLMGHAKSEGNVRLYREYDRKYEHKIDILGVPVKSKELLGVLHLKGFIFDNTLFYSGASINNIYLQQNDRYRYDRYQIIESKSLADSFVRFLRNNFLSSDAVQPLTSDDIPKVKGLRKAITILKKGLRKSGYYFKTDEIKENGKHILLTPILGFGARKNILNKTIHQLIKQTENQVVVFTPYFNFPSKIHSAIKTLLKQGKKVKIIVGDKTANDFYISENNTFNKIGILPYLYEVSLRRFVKSNQKFIDQNLLDVCLWLDEGNSFHLKGINSDQKNYLLTGHNINPRAWRLDIENGVLIQDPSQKLKVKFEHELSGILKNTTRINHFDDIELPINYRPEARKLLKVAKRAKLDSILNRFL